MLGISHRLNWRITLRASIVTQLLSGERGTGRIGPVLSRFFGGWWGADWPTMRATWAAVFGVKEQF